MIRFATWAVGIAICLGAATNQLNANGEEVTFKGFEFGNLQGGADFKVIDALAVGPVLSVSVAQYSRFSVADDSRDIANKSLHEWLTFGAKGTFGL